MRYIAHPPTTDPPGVDDCLAHRCLAHREILSRPEDTCPICEFEVRVEWETRFLEVMDQWARDALDEDVLIAKLAALNAVMLSSVPASDRRESVPHAQGVSAPLLSTVTTPNEPAPGPISLRDDEPHPVPMTDLRYARLLLSKAIPEMKRHRNVALYDEIRELLATDATPWPP